MERGPPHLSNALLCKITTPLWEPESWPFLDAWPASKPTKAPLTSQMSPLWFCHTCEERDMLFQLKQPLGLTWINRLSLNTSERTCPDCCSSVGKVICSCLGFTETSSLFQASGSGPVVLLLWFLKCMCLFMCCFEMDMTLTLLLFCVHTIKRTQ